MSDNPFRLQEGETVEYDTKSTNLFVGMKKFRGIMTSARFVLLNKKERVVHEFRKDQISSTTLSTNKLRRNQLVGAIVLFVIATIFAPISLAGIGTPVAALFIIVVLPAFAISAALLIQYKRTPSRELKISLPDRNFSFSGSDSELSAIISMIGTHVQNINNTTASARGSVIARSLADPRKKKKMIVLGLAIVILVPITVFAGIRTATGTCVVIDSDGEYHYAYDMTSAECDDWCDDWRNKTNCYLRD